MKYLSIVRCFQDGKAGFLKVASGVLFLSFSNSSSVIAAPLGGEIVAGEGGITVPSSSITQIQQLTNNLVIDWQSFNVSADELVQFSQPSSSSAVLNRINDISPSEIFGTIDANGLVFLMNQNGVVFGEGSRIQVGGLIATNLDVDVNQFMLGQYNLESLGMVDGSIVNQGVISASTGGVTLISDTGVVNEGQILATAGSVNLAVATSATLDFTGDGLLKLSISGDVLDNAQSLDDAILNTGDIIAEGGDVLISGQVARDVFTNVVNNSGVIRATRVLNEGGVITLAGPSGDINNSGTLDVSGTEAGEIVVSADNVTHSGLIDASVTEGDGGSVTLQSSADTFLEGASIITTNADNGVGGTVYVLGNRVGLFDESQVNASGITGGGEILIGGDFQGSNPDIQNASQTYVGANTSIIADAVKKGDGGKVIVWADGTTQYYGDISARGGAVSGDGGFVEVSGKSWLDFSGYVNTSAANGEFGTLLLDPKNIIIEDAGAGTEVATVNFADAADPGPDSRFDGDVLAALDTSILLQASNDITINEAIPATASAGNTLTLQAGRSILINADLTTNDADITLVANDALAVDADRDAGNAEITMADGTTIDAGTGNISITMSDGTGLTNSDSGDITLETLVTTGDVTVANNGATAGSDVLQDQDATTAGSTTADNITLSSATGGIGITGAINTTTTTNLSLTTGGAGSAGDITVVESNAGSISNLALTTDASAQTIDLTATSWTVDAALDVGDDTLALRSSTAAGDIAGNGTATNILTAAEIILESLVIDDTADIGYVGGTANTVYMSTPIFTAITGGSANVDNAVEFTDLTLVLDPSTTNDNNYAIAVGGDQTINISDENNIGVRFTFADTSLSDVDITIHNTSSSAAHADIEVRDADINAGAGTVSLISDSGEIFRQANASITAGSLQLSAAGNITVVSDVSSIAAVSSGNGAIDISNSDIDATAGVGGNGALDITTIGPDALGNSFSGISTNDGTITVASTGTITVSEDISNNGAKDISITSSAGDIESVAGVNGVISAAHAAAQIILNANGGIGLLNAVKTSATILSLTTAGNDSAGNITIVDSDDLSTANVTVTTNGTNDVSTRTVDLTALSWEVDGAFAVAGTTTDIDLNLTSTETVADPTTKPHGIFNATGGGADSITTSGVLTLTSETGIGTSLGGATAVSVIEASATGLVLDTAGANADGDIHVDATGSALSLGNVITDTTGQTISITGDSIDLTTSFGDTNDTIVLTAATGDIFASAGTITADSLTLDATGGIGIGGAIDAVANSISLTTAGSGSAGDIFFATTGSFDVFTFSGAVSTAGTGQLVDLTADSWTSSAATDLSGNSVILRATTVGGIAITDKLTADKVGFSVTGSAGAIDAIVDAASVAAITENGGGVSGLITINGTSSGTTTVVVDSVGSIDGLTTTNADITLTTTDENIDIQQDISAGTGSINLTTTDTGSANYDIGGPGVLSTDGGTVTVVADGAININTIIDDSNGDGTGTNGVLSLTSGGLAGSGDITVVDTGILSAIDLSTLSTVGDGQTIDLTADSGWNVTSNIGTTSDLTTLTATTGDIDTGAFRVTANDLTLEAIAGGIGDSVDAVLTNAANLTLISGGTGIAGDIYVSDNGTVTLNGVSTLLDTDRVTVGTADHEQTIGLTAVAWEINGNSGDINDTVAITATGGDILHTSGTGKIYANTLALDAQGVTGGIGASGSAVLTNAGLLTLSSAGNTVTEGDIYVEDSAATSTLGVVTTDAATAQLVDLKGATGWDLTASNVGGANDSISITASAGNIDRSGGTITADSITLDAVTGGIGIGGGAGFRAPVDATATTTTLSLNTGGDGNLGDVFFATTGALDINLFSGAVTTAGSSGQLVDLTAYSWTSSAATDLSGNSVILRADTGGISIGAANTLTADAVGFSVTNSGIADTINVSVDAATVSAITDNGGGGSGSIQIDSVATGTVIVGSVGSIDGLSATNENITLTSVDADIDIQQAINAGINSVYLTTTETFPGTFDFDIGGAATIAASGGITVNADGGINGLNTNVDAGNLSLTSNGLDAAGDITLINNGALFTGQLTALSALGTGVQTFDLTATDWTVGNSGGGIADLVLLGDNLVMTASTGDINDNSWSYLIADNVTLDAAGGIGVIGNVVETGVNGGFLTLRTAGVNAAGNINVLDIDMGGVPVILNSVTTNITGGSNTQVINLTANSGWDVSGNVGDAADTVELITNNGNIDQFAGVIAANDLTLTATNGGIGIVGVINATANSLDLTTGGDDALGDIYLDNNGDLVTSNVAITTTGTNFLATRTVDLEADSWVINGLFDVGDNNLSLTSTETLTANPHGIFNAGGVDSINATQNISLKSATGIGTNLSPIVVSASGISLDTTGAGFDGSIYVDGSGSPLNLSSVSTAVSTQIVSLTANSWTLTSNVDFGDDLLTLIASAGAISDGLSGAGGNTLTAGSIALAASDSIDVSTVASKIEATANGDIRIDSTYSAGDLVIGGIGATVGVNTQNNQNITITSDNANINVTEAISSGDGSTSLTTTTSGDISGAATVTARGGLTVNAADGINLLTDVGGSTLSLTSAGANAAGNITVVDSGSAAAQLTALNTNTTALLNDQTISLTAANGWDIPGAVGNPGSNDAITLIATSGNIRTDSQGLGFACCSALAANDLVLTASNGSIGGGSGLLDPFLAYASNSITVTTGGAGNIALHNADSGTILNSATTAAGAQTIDLYSEDGWEIAGDVGSSDGLDNVTLSTGSGSIIQTNGAATVAADDLTLIANGSIGVGGTLQTEANSLSVTSNGSGALGDIALANTNAGTTTLSGVSTDGTSAQTVDLSTTGGWNIASGGADVGDINDSLILVANNGNIDNASGGLVASTLTLTAGSGAIGASNIINSQADALDLTALGNITVVNDYALSTADVSVTTTGAPGTQTIDLTAAEWTIGDGVATTTDDFNIAGNELLLTASGGSINDDGDGNTIIAANLTLEASGGIGNLNTVNTDIDGGSLNLISTGAGTAGDINVADSGNATVDLTGVSTNGTGQVIQLTADQGWNITSSFGDTTDNITLTANNGDIDRTGAVTITASSLTLDASSGGIGSGVTPILTAADSLALTSGGTNANGDIYLVNTGALTVGNGGSQTLTVATNGANTQTLDLTADSWTIDGSFNVGNDDLNLTTTPTTGGGIFNAAGGAADNITTTGDVALDSNTGIGASGVGNAITVVDVNALTLNTAGVNAAGDIFIVGTGALNLGTGISTDGSAQTISLESTSWTLSADINFTSDNFLLNATGGSIDGNGNTITAASVGLSATVNIDAIVDAQTIASYADGGTTSIDNVSVVNTGDVIVGTVATIDGVTGKGSITLTSADASIDLQQEVRSTTGDVAITTTGLGNYNISGNATITAFNNLTIIADGGIGVSGANPLNIDAGGNLDIQSNGAGAVGDIYIASASNLSLGAVSTADSGQTVDLSAVDWTISAPVDFGDNTLVLRATGNISDGTDNQITAASIGLSAGGTIDVTTDAPLIASVSGGSTRIDSNYNGAGAFSIGSVSGIDGVSTTNSSITVTSADDVIIDSNIVAGSGNISVTSDVSITGTAILNTTGTATLVADDDIILNNANTVSGFDATNTGGGNIEFTNSATTLTLAGISQASGGNVIINNTGQIGINGSVTVTGGDLDLTSTGTLNQVGGIISSDALITSSAGGTSLNQANVINSFNATDSANGDIVLVDMGALDITGINTGGNINLTAGSLTGSGILSGNQLTTTTTDGSVLNSLNAVNIYTASNSTSGNIELNNDAATLTLAGIDQSGSGDVIISNTGNIVTSAAIISNGINLAAGGTITQSSTGTLTGGLLTTQSDGGTTLGLNNALTSFNGTDTAGNILLVDSGTLDITGISTTGNISLTTGSLTDSGTLSGNLLTTQTAGGSTLNSAGNSLNSYNGSDSANGDIVLVDTGALDITGISTGGNISLTAGSLTDSGTLSGNLLTTQTAGGSTLNSAGNSLNSYNGSDSANGDIVLVDTGALDITGISTGGNISLTAGSLTDSGTLSGNLLTTQTAGGSTLNSAGNSFNSYNGSDSANGDIVLVDTDALDITGISTGGNISLTAGSLIGSGILSGDQLMTTTTGGSVLNSLNTVNIYTASNTTSGNIELNNNAATLTLAGIDQTGSGDVIITNTGAIINSGSTISDGAITLDVGGTITQTGAFTGTLLTTSSSGGSTLDNAANNLTGFDGTDTTGGNILIVATGALDIAGVSTTGDVSLTAGSMTGSGIISGNQLETTTSGGSILNNAANAINAYTASDSGGGDIVLDNTGTLGLGSVTTAGNIVVSSTGDVAQSDNIASTGGGGIAVTSSSGSLSMINGLSTTTLGGNITYQASGDVAVSLLDAATGVPADVGTVSVISDNSSVISTDFYNASVRASTVDVTAGYNIGQDELNAFVLSSDIQGAVTLIYASNAYITTAPNVNVDLEIIDLGVGVINSGAARSAGTQRSQSSGLEDVGFIDLALFSDINLFVVDGVGIALPVDQSDEPPLPGNIPVNDEDDEEEKPDGLHVSVVLH